MTDSILSAPYFHQEEAASEFVEARLWPNGPVCPHCGVIGNSAKLKGKSTRIGVHKCRDLPQAFHCENRQHLRSEPYPDECLAPGDLPSGEQQERRFLKPASSDAPHRIREAMRSDDFALFGENGGIVEVDETFIGRDKTIKPDGVKRGRGFHHKNKVLSLVDRNSGQARSFVVDDVKASTLIPIVLDNLSREAKLMTDENNSYVRVGRRFAAHGVVHHKRGEYVAKDAPAMHTNGIEGFFSIFKRGMKGVYQHCAHNHLHRYLAEFDFRYNNRKALGVEDGQRAGNLLRGVVGKRLTYQTTAG